LYTAQDIFNMTMDLVSKRNANGTIDPGKTATYKARSLGLLSLWQSEMQTTLMQTISDPITDLSQEITVNDKVSGPYFLAANLILIEDPDSAGFFEQKFEELKQTIIRRQPATEVAITDTYSMGGYEYQNY